MQQYLEGVIEHIKEAIETFEENGSEWLFESLIKFETITYEYRPTRGSLYIPTPDYLKNKCAIINVENGDDEECFKWAIT
mgnify:CR=1 FL=1